MPDSYQGQSSSLSLGGGGGGSGDGSGGGIGGSFCGGCSGCSTSWYCSRFTFRLLVPLLAPMLACPTEPHQKTEHLTIDDLDYNYMTKMSTTTTITAPASRPTAARAARPAAPQTHCVSPAQAAHLVLRTVAPVAAKDAGRQW